MKLGTTVNISFFKFQEENEAGRVVPDLFFLKQVVCSLVSIYFDSSQLGIQ